MPQFQVEVSNDHIERLAQGRRPILALAELMWNSLDADANRVDVSFHRNVLGMTGLEIADTGTGITELDAETGFTQLGGSWKRLNGTTRRERRQLHGKEGKGRFHAFALGDDVTWTSFSGEPGKLKKLIIRSTVDDVRHGDRVTTDARPDAKEGTTVLIEALNERVEQLATPEACEELSEIFATYLRKYPSVKMSVGGHPIDPNANVIDEIDLTVQPFEAQGRLVTDLVVTVVEWRTPMTKTLYLCGPDGFVRHSIKSGIVAPGFNFTAYAKSAYINELYDSNDLFLGEIHEGVMAVQNASRSAVKNYIRSRLAERAAGLVEEWKHEQVYPYQGEAQNNLEQTERQVFDIVALSVQTHLPTFAAADATTKKLSFQLLRQAMESNPESMQRILRDVLDLPQQKQDELADLLQSTSLASIISASKLVADRLNFLTALECMIYETQPRDEMLERKQLHRLLADHSWIFGEQYHLSVDDESLTRVLQKHIALLGRDSIAPDVKQRGQKKGKQKRVLRLDDSDGIVDLMMSRAVLRGSETEREHLVIELKRPKQPVNQEVISQVTNYALAVARDERFRDTKTKWHFVAISNDLDDVARARAKQLNRPRGLIDILETDLGQPIHIWVKPWSEILEENRARHDFFMKQLNYTGTRESALRALRKTHAKYFPPSLVRDDESA